ncbi:D-alanine--D-alanine ligase [Crocinitomicaceae bacterium]|jgi:D-alanine-D-alanine ligase|nr:D-alanine--D-alanine ligase [Crocinitomicaceae bacterium]MDC3308971.1 D-alanine--D-alanine ligase [Crocinitomicaceae bacterium]
MKTIGLFCGGYSSEYEVSMKSAQLIINNFPKEYELYKIVVSEKGWYGELSDSQMAFDMNSCELELPSGKKTLDAGIICIHGDPGENGKIQAFLDLKGIPYVNSGFESSSLSFDKYTCNQFLKSQNIDTAKSILLRKHQLYNADHICNELGLPLFVKPTGSGSSYGISKVYKSDKLDKAIEFAFSEGEQIILESFLEGRELTCAVFRENDKIRALPITEIISENDFFDYDAKYNGKSKEQTPADIDEMLANTIQALSSEIYDLLGLRSIARIDFILVETKPFVIEVNTIPGFSEASIVPQMLNVAGIDLKDFWGMVIKQELNS